jgi:hypothetical protein
MSRFLRLSKEIININLIKVIELKPNAYKIHIKNDNFKGFTILGIGYIESSNVSHTFTINDKDNKEDYDSVTEWIKNYKFN